MTTSWDFSDRTVMVTGAAQGIGAALASGFHASGAHVVVVDFDEQLLATFEPKERLLPLAVDVADPEQVNEAVTATLRWTGRVDIIVNNAGITRDGVVWKTSDDDWQAVLDVHLGGTFHMTRAAIPAMRAAGYGRIVNVTSFTGLHGNVGQANYAAAKAGIVGFTKTTAKEVARFGITANAVSPNAATAMVASVPDEQRVALQRAIPLGRFASPSEIFPAIAFLASEEAAYVTGVVLPVDGGMAM